MVKYCEKCGHDCHCGKDCIKKNEKGTKIKCCGNCRHEKHEKKEEKQTSFEDLFNGA